MRRRQIILIAAAMLLCLPAAAQQRGGRIEGTIYDDEGMPMAGARVTVASPTQIGGSKKAFTGADGAFRFLGLIPGKFSVKIYKKGFQGVIRKGVRVHVGKTVTLDILLDKAPDAPRPKKPDPTKPEEPGAPVIVTPTGVRTT